jgi:hypothetical protein
MRQNPEFYFKIMVVRLPMALLGGLVVFTLAIAQPQQNGSAQTSQNSQAPYVAQYQSRITVRTDGTATEISTQRLKIQKRSAIQAVSQQQLSFVEGMETLDTVEAFTEKANGRRVSVDTANIMTRDAASEAPATYLRDLKLRTIIFPNVEVGDTLVMTHKRRMTKALFPGQFVQAGLFPRSRAFTSIAVTVEAPVTLDLQVKTQGRSITHRTEQSGSIRRHTVMIAPDSYEPEEAGAVSPLDRDPAIFISTFKSYEEMGLAYGRAASPKAAVTPEIAALANEITKGIADKREQAIAIDGWVKKNIRYVAIILSLGRVLPHDAATVFRNKFGDCKDMVTLMSALLAAKDIASEPVLINLGNAYTLPEPPTLAAINHVILYLPEFDLYDDPTASRAAFGVLQLEAYDKPVVRISAGTAKLAHTPAMRPDDHTIYTRTRINIGADGKITGETEQTGSGAFGMVVRFVGAVVETFGDEAAAQRQLQSLNTPGAGHFDLGNAGETKDPVTIKGSFTLNEHFKPPPSGLRAVIPYGMPLTARPANFLLGSRLNGRKSAFVCYAGRQTEDINATFDLVLPMPIPLKDLTIENPVFSYRSTFKVEGRTFKMHREFISRVTRQSCPPALEAQIASDMDAIRVNVYSTYSFSTHEATLGLPNSTGQTHRIAAADHKLLLDFLYSLDPDCASKGFAAVRVVEDPKNGKLATEQGAGFPNFTKDNPRHECNTRKVDGVSVFYEPNSGFIGPDSIALDVIFPSGSLSRRRYSIDVKPAQIVELTRFVAADQKLQIGFVYALNPDCSSIGYATVNVLERPKNGKVSVENGTGFTNFPQNNPRYECNKHRTDGVSISYEPNEGFTGTDSVTVDIVFPYGNATKRHYSIDVR